MEESKYDDYDEIFGCCTHYQSEAYQFGYVEFCHIPMKYYTVLVCLNCGEVHISCHPVLKKIWKWFLEPWWSGKALMFEDIKIYFKKGELYYEQSNNH